MSKVYIIMCKSHPSGCDVQQNERNKSGLICLFSIKIHAYEGVSQMTLTRQNIINTDMKQNNKRSTSCYEVFLRSDNFYIHRV